MWYSGVRLEFSNRGGYLLFNVMFNVFQCNKLKFELVLYFSVMKSLTPELMFRSENGFLNFFGIKLTGDTALKIIHCIGLKILPQFDIQTS